MQPYTTPTTPTVCICRHLHTSPATDVLLEQWVFEYRVPSPSASPHTSQHSTASGTSQLLTRIRHEPAAVYKRLVVLMRSLFCLVRALPAHRLHRAAQRDGAAMHLRYVVLAGAPAAPLHAGRMVDMALRVVETPFGAFGGSVRYQPHSVVTVLELSVGGRAVDTTSDTVLVVVVVVLRGEGLFYVVYCRRRVWQRRVHPPCVYRGVALRAARPWAAACRGPCLSGRAFQTLLAAPPSLTVRVGGVSLTLNSHLSLTFNSHLSLHLSQALACCGACSRRAGPLLDTPPGHSEPPPPPAAPPGRPP